MQRKLLLSVHLLSADLSMFSSSGIIVDEAETAFGFLIAPPKDPEWMKRCRRVFEAFEHAQPTLKFEGPDRRGHSRFVTIGAGLGLSAGHGDMPRITGGKSNQNHERLRELLGLADVYVMSNLAKSKYASA